MLTASYGTTVVQSLDSVTNSTISVFLSYCGELVFPPSTMGSSVITIYESHIGARFVASRSTFCC